MIPSALLRQSLSIEPYLGDAATGPLYGAAVTASARITAANSRVVTTEGRITQVVADALLRPDVVCPANSRVTSGGETFIVLQSSIVNQMSRPFCRRVQLGFA